MNLASASPVKTKTLTTCLLCGLTTLHPLSNDNGDVICCPSCREVAALLAESPAVEQNQAQVPEGSGEVILTLGGMWCSSCAWLVSENLKRTKGVVSADVNFIQQQANITFDSKITNHQLLKRRVRTLGYQATLPDEKPRDEEESFFTRLLIGGVMVLHDMIVGGGIYVRELMGWATPETAWLVHFFQIMMLVSSLPVLISAGAADFASRVCQLAARTA
ncbi:MAG: cation transporter [Anaerolineales bacterium]|uniref:cation transporter n=1 Tax=Candidatus Villigracilis vicinus TaxID=3140679 RepID=UPI003135E134|nr:cation transporter [Anaerolineales bacterium]